MKTLKCSVAFAVLTLAAMPAEAGGRDLYFTAYDDCRTNTARIKRRIMRQHKRIKFGYREGRISHQAKARLRAHLQRIKEELRYACEDHRVTRYERRHLRRLLNENSRGIASFRYRRQYDYGRRYSYKDVPPPHKSYKDDYREPTYGDDKNDYRRGYEEKDYDGYRDGGSKSLAY